MKKLNMILGISGLSLLLSFQSAMAQTVTLGDEEQFLIIHGQKADCVGVAPMKCLQVKRSLDQPEWENFYTNIHGFEFKEGETALLKVKATKIDHPPADASNIRYELLETVITMPNTL